MQRTPPPIATIDRHPSDSDASTRSETGPRGHNIARNKRRRVADDNINDSLSSMKKELIDLLDTKFNRLDTNMKGLMDHNEEVTKALEYMSSKYDDMKTKCDEMAQERLNDKQYIKELEDRLESMDKINRAATLEIRNIPRNPNETKVNLAELTLNLGKAIDLDITKSEIKDVYRINTQTKENPPVLVKLTTVMRKEEFIRAARAYNKQHSSQLSTSQLKMGLSHSPIYVSEHMTAKTRRLFFLARDYAKSNNFKYCWCAHGRIYLRQKEGAAPLLIKEEKQLEELRCQSGRPVAK